MRGKFTRIHTHETFQKAIATSRCNSLDMHVGHPSLLFTVYVDSTLRKTEAKVHN